MPKSREERIAEIVHHLDKLDANEGGLEKMGQASYDDQYNKSVHGSDKTGIEKMKYGPAEFDDPESGDGPSAEEAEAHPYPQFETPGMALKSKQRQEEFDEENKPKKGRLFGR